MKTGILTFEQFQGKKDIGSSRIRGHWVLKHWDDIEPHIGTAELFKQGGSYDAVIYEKAYFVQHAKSFKGVKIFDLCDPDWFDWGYPFKEMIDEVDVVTVSTEALKEVVSKFTEKPVILVPDRIDLDNLPPPKKHLGDTKSVLWYGYSHNFPVLDSCLPALQKRKLKLIVVADKPYVLKGGFNNIEIENVSWDVNFRQSIQLGDVVINPKWSRGKWKFKSDNKSNLARALGMPVATTEEELDALMTAEARQLESERGLKLVADEYDVKFSARDYKIIIQDIAKQKGL